MPVVRRVRLATAWCEQEVLGSAFHRYLHFQADDAPTLLTNPLSERIDIVQDRNLPQQHLADDVRGFDMAGEDSTFPDGTGRQAARDIGIVKNDSPKRR